MGLRILQIISRSSCDSGGGLQALELTRALKERGHDVWFSAKSGGSAQNRCEGMGLSFVPLAMTGNFDMGSVVRLRRLIKEENIQVIHAHKGLAHTLVLWAVMGLRTTPVVVANRGVTFSLSFWNRWKYAWPGTKGVVAVSESVKRVLEASGVPSGKIRVIYGGVDLKRFHHMDRLEACGRLGLDPSLDYITMVAHFRPWKGHDVLAEAVALLIPEYPSMRVLLAGKTRGRAYKELKDRLREMDLEGYFLFLGFRRDIEVVLGASHILVGPSLEGEGLPGVFREALACERPVVASSVAGAPEIILPGDTGFLVPPGDVGGLAEAISSVLKDEDLRREMGRRGRELVENKFSQESRVRALEEYYWELLESR